MTNAHAPPVAERDVTIIIYHYSLELPSKRERDRERGKETGREKERERERWKDGIGDTAQKRKFR